VLLLKIIIIYIHINARKYILYLNSIQILYMNIKYNFKYNL